MLEWRKFRLLATALLLLVGLNVMGQSGPSNVGYAHGDSEAGQKGVDHLTFWIDLADLNGDGIVDTDLPSNGDPISIVKDKSGYNHHATIDDATRYPHFYNDGNLKYMRFDGVRDYLFSDVNITHDSVPEVTVICVYKLYEDSPPTLFDGIWGCDNGDWDRFFIIDHHTIGSGVATNGSLFTVDGINRRHEWFIFTTQYDLNQPNGSTIWLNNKQGQTFTDTHTNPGQPGMFIGQLGKGHDNEWNNNFEDYGAVDIAEMIVYDKVLTCEERKGVELYLAKKYGLGLDYFDESSTGSNGIQTDIAGVSFDHEMDVATSSGISIVPDQFPHQHGDALYIAHDNAAAGARTLNYQSGAQYRANRTWWADFSSCENRRDSLDIVVDLTHGAFDTLNNYGFDFKLLVQSGGTWDGWWRESSPVSATKERLVFRIAPQNQLNDSYFTLGVACPKLFNVTGKSGTFCANDVSGTEIGLDGSEPAAQYELILNGVPIDTLDGTGGPISFGNQTQSGTYYVRALGITTNCCQSYMNGYVQLYIYPAPNAGTASNAHICENLNSFDVKSLVTGYDAGGYWYVNDNYHSGVLSASEIRNNNRFRVLHMVYNQACTDTVWFTIDVDKINEAGTASDVAICESEGEIDLWSQVQGGQTGGIWSSVGASLTIDNGTWRFNDAERGQSYTFKYKKDEGVCPADSVEFDVRLDSNAIVGTTEIDTMICEVAGTVDLNTYLDGTSTGGTWSSLTPGANLNGSIWILNTSTEQAYRFRYTIPGGACQSVTIDLTIHLDGNVSSGVATQDATLCEDLGEVNLDQFITGGSVNGVWLTNDPSLVLLGDQWRFTEGMGGQDYTFFYAVNGGACASDTTELTVHLDPVVTAGGLSNDSKDLCQSLISVNLNDYLIGADEEGVWSVVAGNTSIIDSIWYIPANGGDQSYTFRYLVDGKSCASDSLDLTLNLTESISAGSVVEDTTICEDVTSVNLNDYLSGENTGGVWKAIAPANLQIVGNIWQLNGAEGGAEYKFRYVLDGGVCSSDSVGLTLYLDKNVSAGTIVNENTYYCESVSSIDLFESIQDYTEGGQWTALTPGVSLVGSTWTLTGQVAGSYSFRYVVEGGKCSSDSIDLTIHLDQEVTAGATVEETTLCESEVAVDLNNYLEGQTSGGIWVGLDNGTILTGSVWRLNGSKGGQDYHFRYLIDGGACASDSVDLTLHLDSNVVAGEPLNSHMVICESTESVHLFDFIKNYTAGGTWTAVQPGMSVVGDLWTLTGQTIGSYQFKYVVDGNTCPSDSLTITIHLDGEVEAGTTVADTGLCELAGDVNLFTFLEGSDVGGVWTALEQDVQLTGSTWHVDAQAGGRDFHFRYVVGGGECKADSVDLMVRLDSSVTAGNIVGGSLSICEDDVAIDLNDYLENQTVGGVWVNLQNDGSLVGSNWSTSGLEGEKEYAFRYVVDGKACAADSIDLNLYIDKHVEAGSVAKDTGLCETVDTVDLNEYLSADAMEGTWKAVSSGLNLNENNWLPVEGMGGQDYHFRYIVDGGACASDSLDLTIRLDSTIDAGFANNIAICANVGSLDLQGQLSGATLGGVWTALDNQFAINGTTASWNTNIAAGAYDFRYSVDGLACSADSVVLTVQIDTLISAGVVTGDTTICEAITSVDLNDYLSGNSAGGVWTSVDGYQIDGSIWNTNGAQGGRDYQFVYTVDGKACESESVTLTLRMDPEVSAGGVNSTTGDTVSVCEVEGILDLDNYVYGVVGDRKWEALTVGLNLNGSSWNIENVATEQTYSFLLTVDGKACDSDSLTLHIYLDQQVDAGSAMENAAVCVTQKQTGLFDYLNGATPGGTWTALTNGVSLQGDTWVFGNAATGNEYRFKYVVDGGACDSDSTILTLRLDPLVEAGTAIDELVHCELISTINLNNYITGNQAGGTWSSNQAGVTVDGAQATADWEAGMSYRFVYTVDGLSCDDDSVVVNIHIENQNNAGSFDATTICITETELDLSGFLNVSNPAGGNWIIPAGHGQLEGNTWKIANVQAGETYQLYYEHQDGVCPSDSALLEVSIAPEVTAGSADSIEVCETELFVDLSEGMNNWTIGGHWTVLETNKTYTDPWVQLDEFNGAGHYAIRYVIESAYCMNDSAEFDLHITPTVSAGQDTTISMCMTQAVFNLSELTDRVDTTGTWYNHAGQEVINSLVNTDHLATGAEYIFMYVVDGIACANDTATLSLTLHDKLYAGEDRDIRFCESKDTIELSSLTNGMPGGVWTLVEGNGALRGDQWISDASDKGDRLALHYVVSSQACGTDTAFINVSWDHFIFAGTPLHDRYHVCETVDSINLYDQVKNPAPNGIWKVDDQLVIRGILYHHDLKKDTAYQVWYVADGGACPDDSLNFKIEIDHLPEAGDMATDVLCEDGTYYDLFTLLDNFERGGTWTSDDVQYAIEGTNLNMDKLLIQGGEYFDLKYTISNDACPADSVELTVSVENQPYAGEDTLARFCQTDTQIDLKEIYGVNKNIHWKNVLSNLTLTDEGILTWDRQTTEFGKVYELNRIYQGGKCPTDTATVGISIDPIVTAGVATPDTVCNNETDINLFDYLKRYDQGVWYDEIGAISDPRTYNFPQVISTGYTATFDYLVDGLGCPDDSTQLTLFVEPALSAGNSELVAYCETQDQINLQEELDGEEVGGFWVDQFGNELSLDSVKYIDLNEFTPKQDYFFRYIIDGKRCKADTAMLTFRVDTLIHEMATVFDSICNDTGVVDLGQYSPVGLNTPWFSAELGYETTELTLDMQDAGDYHFFQHVEGGSCADDSAELKLTIIDSPKALDLDDLFECPEDTLFLTSLLEGKDYDVTWYLDNVPLDSPVLDLTKLEDDGQYLVSAEMTNQRVCHTRSEFDLFLRLDECSLDSLIKVPDVITPNGDGSNDRFIIEGNEFFEGIYLGVYNRWGVLLFEDMDYHNDWDGTTYAGEPVAEGTYYIIMRVKHAGKVYTKRFFVTVVR